MFLGSFFKRTSFLQRPWLLRAGSMEFDPLHVYPEGGTTDSSIAQIEEVWFDADSGDSPGSGFNNPPHEPETLPLASAPADYPLTGLADPALSMTVMGPAAMANPVCLPPHLMGHLLVNCIASSEEQFHQTQGHQSLHNPAGVTADTVQQMMMMGPAALANQAGPPSHLPAPFLSNNVAPQELTAPVLENPPAASSNNDGDTDPFPVVHPEVPEGLLDIPMNDILMETFDDPIYAEPFLYNLNQLRDDFDPLLLDEVCGLCLLPRDEEQAIP
jgi:hypothetical protein